MSPPFSSHDPHTHTHAILSGERGGGRGGRKERGGGRGEGREEGKESSSLLLPSLPPSSSLLPRKAEAIHKYIVHVVHSSCVGWYIPHVLSCHSDGLLWEYDWNVGILSRRRV